MEIIKDPSPILHKKLTYTHINHETEQIIKNMQKKMIQEKGIGLAANQVGLDMRIFVIDETLAKEYNAPLIFINPEIQPYSKDEDIMQEGCLSLPGTWLDIKRAKKVKVKALNEKGDKIKFIAKGILARVVQHEFDHLEGILITEKS